MYAKLFGSIYQGTLRGNAHGLLVFTNMLAHCDARGHVDIHPRMIAEEVGLSVEQVRAALDYLEAPDPESRSPEHEGRRIVRLDEHRAWGWIVVNYAKYRAIRNEEDRREQNRLAQERWRSKQNKPASATSKQSKPPSAQAEAEEEAKEGKSKDCASRKRAANSHGERLPDDQPTPELIAWAETARPDLDVRTEAESFRDYWRAQPGAKGRKSDWPATWRNWIRRANRSNAGTAGPPRGKYGGPMTLPERQAAAMADYYAKHAKTVNAKEGTNGRNGDGAVLGTDDGDLRGALVIDLRPSAGGRVPAGVGADVVPDDSGADQPIPADLPF